MSQFTEDLVLKWIPWKKKFKVFVEFKYHVGSEDSVEVVTIPEGFETDLASIPPVARWLIPKLGKHAQAAVVHDYLYNQKMYTRKKCDEIFLEAMEVLKVPLWKRRIMYRAVRSCGAIKRKGLKVSWVTW